jgi:hypothetical protein
LAADRAGNVFALGSFQGVADFNPARNRSTVLEAATGGSEFLARYSAAGTLAWAVRIPETASARALATDASGNLYVVGRYAESTDFNFAPARRFTLENTGGTFDVFVAKYASDGGLVWANRVEGIPNQDEDATGVAVDGLGYVHVSGMTHALSGASSFVATFTARGRTLRGRWFGNRELGGTSNVGLAADPDGSVYLAGTNGYDVEFKVGPNTCALPANSIYLLKLNARGRLGWIDTFDGLRLDFASLAADRSGVYVAGWDMGGSDLNPAAARVYELPGSGNAFLARYAPTGALAFATPLEATLGAEADHVALDPATGDAVVSGLFAGTADLNAGGAEPFHVQSEGGLDAFVARFNPAGQFLSGAAFGATNRDDNDPAPLLAVSPRRAVIGGWVSWPVDFDPGPRAWTFQSDPDAPFNHQAGYLAGYVWA